MREPRTELSQLNYITAVPLANNMLDIGRPSLDWVKLSEGAGVSATRAATTRDFVQQFTEALRAAGPRLVEAVL